MELRIGNQYDENSFASYLINSFDNAGKRHAVYWLKNAEKNEDYSNLDPYVLKMLAQSNDSKWLQTYVKDGIITKSPAVSACENKGLSLPTHEEYEALRNCFAPKEVKEATDFMSEDDRKNMYSYFPDMYDPRYDTMDDTGYGTRYSRHYWSSSVLRRDPTYTYFFESRFGQIDAVDRVSQYDEFSVRCVARIDH